MQGDKCTFLMEEEETYWQVNFHIKIAWASERYNNVPQYRIYEAINAGATVVDVDGSYLYKKHKTLTDAGHRPAPLNPLVPPPSGWVTISSENYLQVAPDLPTVTAGQYTIKLQIYQFLISFLQAWCTHSRSCWSLRWWWGSLQNTDMWVHSLGIWQIESTSC